MCPIYPCFKFYDYVINNITNMKGHIIKILPDVNDILYLVKYEDKKESFIEEKYLSYLRKFPNPP